MVLKQVGFHSQKALPRGPVEFRHRAAAGIGARKAQAAVLVGVGPEVCRQASGARAAKKLAGDILCKFPGKVLQADGAEGADRRSRVPSPYGAVVVGRVLVVPFPSLVVWMEEPVALRKRAKTVRKKQFANRVPRDSFFDFFGNEIFACDFWNCHKRQLVGADAEIGAFVAHDAVGHFLPVKKFSQKRVLDLFRGRFPNKALVVFLQNARDFRAALKRREPQDLDVVGPVSARAKRLFSKNARVHPSVRVAVQQKSRRVAANQPVAFQGQLDVGPHFLKEFFVARKAGAFQDLADKQKGRVGRVVNAVSAFPVNVWKAAVSHAARV